MVENFMIFCKMSSDFSDSGNSVPYNSQEDSDNFALTGVEQLVQRTNIDYNTSIRVDSSCNKPIISVARRNERERKRVRLVNQGFAILRDRVPRDRCSRGRRSSKVETLRAAIMYIRQLQQLLLESQIRYHDQDMQPSYITEDSCLNSPLTPVCDHFAFNSGYPHIFVQTPTYPHLRTNTDPQYSNQGSDRHLALQWFV